MSDGGEVHESTVKATFNTPCELSGEEAAVLLERRGILSLWGCIKFPALDAINVDVVERGVCQILVTCVLTS